MSITLFDQTDISGADTPRRCYAQKFNPTADGEVTAIEVNVRTTSFDGAGGRNKRLVVLNSDRSAYLGASAWSSTAFTEGVLNAWNQLTLSSPTAVEANTDCWLGLEFQNTDASEDIAQVRSSEDDVGAFSGSNTPTGSKRIFVAAGSSSTLLDAVDGTNVIEASAAVGFFAFRAIGNLITREGWGMLI